MNVASPFWMKQSQEAAAPCSRVLWGVAVPGGCLQTKGKCLALDSRSDLVKCWVAKFVFLYEHEVRCWRAVPDISLNCVYGSGIIESAHIHG